MFASSCHFGLCWHERFHDVLVSITTMQNNLTFIARDSLSSNMINICSRFIVLML